MQVSSLTGFGTVRSTYRLYDVVRARWSRIAQDGRKLILWERYVSKEAGRGGLYSGDCTLVWSSYYTVVCLSLYACFSGACTYMNVLYASMYVRSMRVSQLWVGTVQTVLYSTVMGMGMCMGMDGYGWDK